LVVEVKNTVGLDEQAFAGMLRIYPNPAKGRFIIEKTAAFSGKVDITVLNSLSETVYVRKKADLSLDDFTIDLTRQGQGVYLLVIETEGNRCVVKRLINQ